MSILDHTAQAIAVLFRNFPCAHIFEAFPHFLLYKFQCLWFYVELLDPLRFDLSTRRGMDQFTFFYMITASCASPFVENSVIFPLGGFISLVKDQVTIGVWVHFWVFNSIPLIYFSVAIPVLCSFCHSCSVVQF